MDGKIIHLAPTAFIAFDLLCAITSWYGKQTADSVGGSIIIQVVGVVVYFIAIFKQG